MTTTGTKTQRLVWSGPVHESVGPGVPEKCITATVRLERWNETDRRWERTRFADGILVRDDDPKAAEKLAAEHIWYAAESRVLGSAGLSRDEVEILDRDS